jgi:hypothetical protein
MLAARCKRVYANAHTYHINSISVNSDQETFLSADDLRINLWNLDVTDQSFNVVDIKPNNMEDLTEVSCLPPCTQLMSSHAERLACVSAGDHVGRVPSQALQCVCVQQQQRLHPARGHAGLRPVRPPLQGV